MNKIKIWIGLILLSIMLIGGFHLMAQSTGSTQPNTENKSSTQADSKTTSDNDIPAEFKNIGEGLPPSKRRQLQAWLFKLQFDTPYPRMHAAREIYWYKQKESIPYLVDALRDTYWGVRQAAAHALAHIGEKKYTYIKYSMPSGSELRQLRESLSKKDKMPLHEKGDVLLKAEKIKEEKIEIDIIAELKTAYYKESQVFQDPMVLQEIRRALEILGAIEEMKIKTNGVSSK